VYDDYGGPDIYTMVDELSDDSTKWGTEYGFKLSRSVELLREWRPAVLSATDWA